MVVYSKSRVDIAVTAHAVKHISDGPRPKLWHSLLQIKAAHFEASSQKTCIFKIDGKNLPGFGMNVTPDIVALRVDRGTVEFVREIASWIGFHFEDQTLRIVQRLVVTGWQRIIVAAKRVDRTH